MKSSKIFKGFLVFLAAIFIINQLVSSLYMPIKTENAVFYTANDGFKITGYIIKLAQLFHSFYSHCYVVDENNKELYADILKFGWDSFDKTIIAPISFLDIF